MRTQTSFAATGRGKIYVAMISIALIVCFPVSFWMLILEWAVPALGFDYGLHDRLAFALSLGGLLFMIWAMIWNARDRNLPDTQTDHHG